MEPADPWRDLSSSRSKDLAQPTRFSRLAGGRIRNKAEPRDRARALRRWRPALLDMVAMAVAAVSILYLASDFLSSPGLSTVVAPGAGMADSGAPVTAKFPICVGQHRVTCVVDGDTIWLRGTKIRVADINAPEVSKPHCPAERARGDEATARLRQLLNAGPFEVLGYPRDADRYGRKLRILSRNGQSLGMQLVAEGLAAEWDGPRIDWCG